MMMMMMRMQRKCSHSRGYYGWIRFQNSNRFFSPGNKPTDHQWVIITRSGRNQKTKNSQCFHSSSSSFRIRQRQPNKNKTWTTTTSPLRRNQPMMTKRMRLLSSSSKNNNNNNNNNNTKNDTIALAVANQQVETTTSPMEDGRVVTFKPKTTTSTKIIRMMTMVAVVATASYQVRRVRNRWIEDVLPVWIVEEDDTNDDDENDEMTDSSSSSSWKIEYPNRTLDSILSAVQRAGLMGQKHVSVKEELDHIRKWHIDNGFKGGLVVRDLTKPLFQWTDDDRDKNNEKSQLEHQHTEVWKLDLQTFGRFVEDPMRLARRECYYLYYELEPDGRITQQIFCRGTTLSLDILTCLQAIMEYDEDLGCAVHKGFRDQANRVLEDVLPLLSPPNDRRAVIEVCGHSLGGAVATILAVKLLKRGYKVTRITTVGEPAYVKSRKDARELEKLLPKDHIRIEDDRDFVPFLPPFGSHAGNKIWLLHKAGGGKARFVKDQSWTDSFWLNFCLPEILMAYGQPHRIPNYLRRLSEIQCRDNID